LTGGPAAEAVATPSAAIAANASLPLDLMSNAPIDDPHLRHASARVGRVLRDTANAHLKLVRQIGARTLKP